jgi:hypothetical protein
LYSDGIGERPFCEIGNPLITTWGDFAMMHRLIQEWRVFFVESTLTIQYGPGFK